MTLEEQLAEVARLRAVLDEAIGARAAAIGGPLPTLMAAMRAVTAADVEYTAALAELPRDAIEGT